MFNVALASSGAQVSLASSSDEKHQPDCIIDGSPNSFWASTGLFPQELVVSFQGLMSVSSIKIDCSSVKHFRIERSVSNDPIDFEPLHERELDNANDLIQTEDLPVSSGSAKHIKFIFDSGYDHFISVHNIQVIGSAVHS
ncbi:DgyrCDS11858 [Dimorphilus gyrociliatus]|uniref:DgyrCDS11858 n=1 Tax=Dimorphilus gyrociliatus TaxID=2664684 RepID=A0A7I8W4Q5_9ANNE|nr:DgyrCDS11858 [Dimorphilus gyrociliatus]